MVRVIIEDKQRVQYEQRGYRYSSGSAREIIGEQGWAQMPPETREILIVMECHEDARLTMDLLPTAYVLDLCHRTLISMAFATKVDVQERGERDSIVADAAGSRAVSTTDVKASPREAIQPYRSCILEAIEEHRQAALDLEHLLRRHECL